MAPLRSVLARKLRWRQELILFGKTTLRRLVLLNFSEGTCMYLTIRVLFRYGTSEEGINNGLPSYIEPR